MRVGILSCILITTNFLVAQENYPDSSKHIPVVTYEINLLAFGGGISNSRISEEISPDIRYLNKTWIEMGLAFNF